MREIQLDRRLYVIGYHGTTDTAAEHILYSIKSSINNLDFSQSANPYDWLGAGAYFFEDAPLRAWTWAKQVASKRKDKPGVVCAKIRMLDVVDLLDIKWWDHISRIYNRYIDKLKSEGMDIPSQEPLCIRANAGPWFLVEGDVVNTKINFGRNELDCKVINYFVEHLFKDECKNVRAVRAAFLEGYEAYRNSYLYTKSHVQIAVRDLSLIRKVSKLDRNILIELEQRYLKPINR